MDHALETSESTPVHFSVPATFGRRLGELLVSLVWALYGYMTVFSPADERFLPFVTIPFSVLASLHFLARVVDGRPRLIIDVDGILDRTSVVGGDVHIHWDEVLSVSPSLWWGSVEVEVRNLEEIADRSDWRRRLALRAWALVGKRSISITPVMLGIKKKPLCARIDAGLLVAERKAMGLIPPPLGRRRKRSFSPCPSPPFPLRAAPAGPRPTARARPREWGPCVPAPGAADAVDLPGTPTVAPVHQEPLKAIERHGEAGLGGVPALELLPALFEFCGLIVGKETEKALCGHLFALVLVRGPHPSNAKVSPASISTISWMRSIICTRSTSTSSGAYSARRAPWWPDARSVRRCSRGGRLR